MKQENQSPIPDFEESNFGSLHDCVSWLQRNGWIPRRRGPGWFNSNWPDIILHILPIRPFTYRISFH